MPTTTDTIDQKEICGYEVCLWRRKQFELRGRGGVGEDIWVSARIGDKFYRSQVICITDRFERRKDQIQLSANEILELERLSDNELRVKLKGITSNYWLSLFHYR